MKASRSDVQSLTVLSVRADFLRVQSTGVKWVAKGLIFQAAPNETGGRRLGLTASKRLSPSAVRRNRIRRRLRAAARDVLPVCAKTGFDYVLTGRPETATRAYADLCEDLRWCLRKTGLAAES